MGNSNSIMDETQPYLLIKLSSGDFVKIDPEDYPKVSKHHWYLNTFRGLKYAKTSSTVNGKKKCIGMHSIILIAGEGLEIDHINNDGLDNRKSNLRICTHRQNLMNVRAQTGKSSKYKGVSKTQDNTWKAVSRVSGEQKYLGRFKTEKEAAIAYDNEVIKYGDEHAFLNFPERRNDVH